LSRELGRLNAFLDEHGVEWAVKHSVQIERFAFVTAYIMRKLDEADALTRDVTDSEWPVVEFPCLSPPPHRKWFLVSEDLKTWRQPLEQHYDLSTRSRRPLRFGRICDLIIHHFAFEARHAPADDRVELLFNSDHTRNEGLFLMGLTEYKALVREVAQDVVQWVDMSRDEGRVIQRRRRPADW
jgi:hypothetical protein